MRHILIVLSDPVPGSEDAYHEWYTGTHLREIVATPGFQSAERFEFVSTNGEDPSHRHIAIYEFEGDVDDAKAALTAGRTTRVPVPDAMEPSPTSWWFTSISDRVVDDEA